MAGGIKSLVGGWGINDVEYLTNITKMVDGVYLSRKTCDFYKRWQGIILRCYMPSSLKVASTYRDVVVCEEWRYLSKFKSWMETQDWKGLHLDKDILLKGSKIYSPETCAFVPQYLNKLLLTRDGQRGEYPLGVSIKSHSPKRENKFQSGVVVGGKRKGLGVYADYVDAHRAWQLAKADVIEQAILKYMLEPSYRQDVANALYLRAEMLRDDHASHRETFCL